MEKEDLTQKLNQMTQDPNAKIEEATQQSRILLLILDAIENFEYKYQKIAGCIYALAISLVLAFLLTMRDKHFSDLPYLELMFVPILLMFCANFKLISTSSILPYITEQGLNWTVKHASISLILSIVLLVCSFQNQDKFVSMFFYVGIWPLNRLYESIRQKNQLEKNQLLPLICLFIGTVFSTGTVQIITSNPELLSIKGIIYALVGGILFCYSADCFKKLEAENLFTITHVIGLMTIIFLPLFFPVEGLQQPGIKEWIFFCLVAILLEFGFPILIRAFAIESPTIILAQMGWGFPFYIFFKFLFGLSIPSFGTLFGVGIFVISALLVIKNQNQQQQKTVAQIKKREPTLQPQIVELQTLSQG